MDSPHSPSPSPDPSSDSSPLSPSPPSPSPNDPSFLFWMNMQNSDTRHCLQQLLSSSFSSSSSSSSSSSFSPPSFSPSSSSFSPSLLPSPLPSAQEVDDFSEVSIDLDVDDEGDEEWGSNQQEEGEHAGDDGVGANVVAGEGPGPGAGEGGRFGISGSLSAETVVAITLKWLERAGPYLALFLLIFLWHHRSGLVLFFVHLALLSFFNFHLKKLVKERGDESDPCFPLSLLSAPSPQNPPQLPRKTRLFLLSVGTLLPIILTTHYYPSVHSTRYLFFLLPTISEEYPFLSVLFVIILGDLFAVYLTICLKSVVSLFDVKNTKSQYTRVLSLIEAFSSVYREALPVRLWIWYFMETPGNQVVSFVINALYLFFKLSDICVEWKRFHTHLTAFLSKTSPYGPYATEIEAQKVGDCSICHDRLKEPIKLLCDHLFCEDCISLWLETEKTCPLCRRVLEIAGRHPRSDGSTSLSIRFF